MREKTPKEIHIKEKDEHGEPIEIKQRSDVIKAISQPKLLLKIQKSFSEQSLLRNYLQNWNYPELEKKYARSLREIFLARLF